MPSIHDLSDLRDAEAYDETQTNDEIKDGDFLIFKWGVAYMNGAWPTLITLRFGNVASSNFHRFEDHEMRMQKVDEFRALKKERGWHSSVTPSEIAHALITIVTIETGAHDAYDLNPKDLWAKFNSWNTTVVAPMHKDIERCLVRLGFERP